MVMYGIEEVLMVIFSTCPRCLWIGSSDEV